MKKRIIIVGILILIPMLYITAAWNIGSMIHNNIDHISQDIAKKINQQQDDFTIIIDYDSYEQHIFYSQVNISVTLENKNHDSSRSFSDRITIHHGPFPLTALLNGNFHPQIAWIDYALSDAKLPLSLQSQKNSTPLLISLSVDFFKKITLKLTNLDNRTFSDLFKGTYADISHSELTLARGDIMIAFNPNDHDFILKGKIDSLLLIINNTKIILDHPSFSIYPVQKYENVAYSVSAQSITVNDHVTHSPDINELNSSLNIEDISIEGEVSLHLPQTITASTNIKKISYMPNDEKNPFVAFNFTSTQTHSRDDLNSLLTGEFSGAIQSLAFGQQNLGYGDIKLSYNGMNAAIIDQLINIIEQNKIADDDLYHSSSYLSVDKLNWHNDKGDMSVNFNTQLANVDNVEQFNLNINLPFIPLAYLIAQVNSPESQYISNEQLNDMNDSVQLSAIALSKFLPIFEFNRLDIDGIYTDLSYSKKNKQLKINDKIIDKNQLSYLIYSHSLGSLFESNKDVE